MNISKPKQFMRLLTAISLMSLFFITGCAENDQPDYELHTGVFKDSAVKGLRYKTPTNDGMTDKDGTFFYCNGEMITFFVGDIQLGQPAKAKSLMTPIDLVPKDKGNPEKNKLFIARFLQTLDADKKLENGIQIDKKVHDNSVKTESFDPASVIFIADENDPFTKCEHSIISALKQFETTKAVSSALTLVDEASAQVHLNKAEHEQNKIENDPAGSSNISDQIITRRDNMGVWFITGPAEASLYSVFYEVGYQVATDRLWQLEQYRRAATGTLSEWLGESQLESDMLIRTIGYSQDELEAGFNGLDEESKSVIQGYVDGINCRIDYVMLNRSQMPMEYVALEAKSPGSVRQPGKWSPTDLLAWNVLLQRQFDPEALKVDHGQLDNIKLMGRLMEKYHTDISAFLGQDPGTTLMGQAMFKDLRWNDDPDAQTYILDEDVPDEWKTSQQTRTKTTVAIPKIPDYSDAINKLQLFRRKVQNNLERINANVKMGSYAWVVGPEKTKDGKPILYAGPQMGFDSPAICIECSIDAGGLKVSGMMIPGIPGVILGRTPHHAWSMQVGHVHSTDFYFDFDPTKPEQVDRAETIKIIEKDDLELPIFKINGRPVISPMPFNPASYTPSQTNPIVSWRYSHVGYEFNMVSAMLAMARAKSIEEFGDGIELLGLSQHFCYADKDGNIAYWMSGRDPVRPNDPVGLAYQLPQGSVPNVPQMDWDESILKDRSKLVNPTRHYFAGWNNKSHPYYSGSPNSLGYFTGPFHRSHIIYDYLDSHNNLTYEDVRDLSKHIASTDSIAKGGNAWPFVKDLFSAAVASNSSEERLEAITLLNEWSKHEDLNDWRKQGGHFVNGENANWAQCMDRTDGWMLMDTWVRKVIEKTFSQYLDVLADPEDAGGENGAEGAESKKLFFGNEYQRRLLNVIIRSFKGRCNYDWYNNNLLAPPGSDQYTAAAVAMKTKAYSIIVEALDETLADLGEKPWGVNKRELIEISNAVLSQLVGDAIPGWKIWRIPFGSRSTYAQCVQFDINGPDRIESFFPLGQSTLIYWHILLSEDVMRFLAPHKTTLYHKHFFDMSIKYFDRFVHREFPLFSK